MKRVRSGLGAMYTLDLIDGLKFSGSKINSFIEIYDERLNFVTEKSSTIKEGIIEWLERAGYEGFVYLSEPLGENEGLLPLAV